MRRFKTIFLIFFFFNSLFCIFTLRAEAGIVLKLLAANPSQEQSQRVPVKAYLPKEAKPEDIIDKSDLDVAYDTQQGSYYVYGEYELKPLEVLEKEIELKDIWVVSSTEIESLRMEAIKLFGLLKNTEFAERVDFLKNSVEAKLNQVIESQKDSPANPERHISDYRENVKVIDSVKADIALARNLLTQAKPFSVVLVWKLIVIIIIFLGVLGGSFYFIWQKQVKLINQDTVVPQETTGQNPGQESKSGETKLEDEIDKIMRSGE